MHQSLGIWECRNFGVFHCRVSLNFQIGSVSEKCLSWRTAKCQAEPRETDSIPDLPRELSA